MLVGVRIRPLRQVEPLQVHLKAARHCLAYLLETKELGITYSSDGTAEGEPPKIRMFQARKWASKPYNKVQGYSDADWAGQMPGRKSTSGYVFMLNGGAVSWRSFTQPVVAQSTAEAEYIALNAVSYTHLTLPTTPYV